MVFLNFVGNQCRIKPKIVKAKTVLNVSKTVIKVVASKPKLFQIWFKNLIGAFSFWSTNQIRVNVMKLKVMNSFQK